MSNTTICVLIILALCCLPLVIYVPMRLFGYLSEKLDHLSEGVKIAGVLMGLAGIAAMLNVVHTSILVALLVGLVASLTTVFVLNKPKKMPISAESQNRPVDSIIADTEEKLTIIRSFSAGIRNSNLDNKIQSICIITGKICDSIRNDPRDLVPAKKFLGYYLDTTLKLLEKYTHMQRMDVVTPDCKTRLAKIEETIGLLQEAFEQQLMRLMENDYIDVDAEISVLKSTLKMEGFV